MKHMRFLFKAVIVCSGKEEGFDSKNNHRYNKADNFWLDNISKINCRMLVVLLYTLSWLGSIKV